MDNMKTSERGIDLIKSFEGLSLKTYKCPAGIDTIGYGHTGNDVKPDMVITEQQAEELLKKDLNQFEIGVGKLITSGINQNQFDALVSFAYNLGTGALQKSTLLKKVNADPDDLAIAKEFNKWVLAGGKRLEGLVRRRKAESDLYFGIWEG